MAGAARGVPGRGPAEGPSRARWSASPAAIALRPGATVWRPWWSGSAQPRASRMCWPRWRPTAPGGRIGASPGHAVRASPTWCHHGRDRYGLLGRASRGKVSSSNAVSGGADAPPQPARQGTCHYGPMTAKLCVLVTPRRRLADSIRPSSLERPARAPGFALAQRVNGSGCRPPGRRRRRRPAAPRGRAAQSRAPGTGPTPRRPTRSAHGRGGAPAPG